MIKTKEHKIVLIYGGSGSGKSRFAEDYLRDFKNKYYIATMKIHGEEGLKRVEKHREQRADKDFVTIEKCSDMNSIPGEYQIPDGSVALLECMSNLVANEMFKEDRVVCEPSVSSQILAGIDELVKTFELLVIVTNNTFEDGGEYDEYTLEYMRALAGINIKLAQAADEVYEVVAGKIIQLKERTLNQNNERNESGLVFIIGGYAQGKYEYAISHYPNKEIFNEFHLWVKEQLLLKRTKEQILAQVKEYIQLHRDAVIICDEIGNGIIPIDRFERDYREILGDITQYLAKEAVIVERVVCSLGQYLKP